jgi:hypothetical protein
LVRRLEVDRQIQSENEHESFSFAPKRDMMTALA